MEPLIFWTAAWRKGRDGMKTPSSALILMGDWCGKFRADTDQRNIGRGRVQKTTNDNTFSIRKPLQGMTAIFPWTGKIIPLTRAF
jgi:hypothetical protein